MNLAYEAIDTNGRQVRDIAEASSAKEAIEALRHRGLMVTHIEPASEGEKAKAETATGDLGSIKFPLKQLMIFTRQMAMLLTSGSAVVQALSAVSRQMKKPEQAAMIKQIQRDLEEGSSFTDALRKYPRAFDPIYCALVAAGEASATMPEMFVRIASMTAKKRAVQSKVVGAMAYPILLIFLCVVILNVLLFFVMPRFATMFDTLGVPLPWSTEFMLKTSDAAITHWYVVVGVIAVVVGSAVFLLKTPTGRQWISDVQIKIPLIGKVASSLILARALRVLGLLTESHIGILESMELTRGVTRNSAYQKMFAAMEDAVTTGKSLSGALDSSGLPSPALCQAIQTGEETGNLGGAISFSADVLEEENRELIEAVTKLIEPLILIVMGLVIGTVAISLFLPLFDMTSAV